MDLGRRIGVIVVCATIPLAAAGCDNGTDTTDRSLVAPSATFAPPADPAIVANIDAVEADYVRQAGESYSYLLTYYETGRDDPECGLQNARIVVEEGEITDAVGLPSGQHPGCHLDPADVPTLAELFDLARSVAGASEFEVVTRVGDKMVSVKASDTDFELSLFISELSPSIGPTSIGWDEIPAATAAARARWKQQSFDYTVSITWLNFLLGNTTRTTTVIDGEIVAATEGGEQVDPATLSGPWPPFTVDDLFDIIEGEAELAEGRAVVVFEPDTGLPSSVDFNSSPEIADDEIIMFATIERL